MTEEVDIHIKINQIQFTVISLSGSFQHFMIILFFMTQSLLACSVQI